MEELAEVILRSPPFLDQGRTRRDRPSDLRGVFLQKEWVRMSCRFIGQNMEQNINL